MNSRWTAQITWINVDYWSHCWFNNSKCNEELTIIQISKRFSLENGQKCWIFLLKIRLFSKIKSFGIQSMQFVQMLKWNVQLKHNHCERVRSHWSLDRNCSVRRFIHTLIHPSIHSLVRPFGLASDGIGTFYIHWHIGGIGRNIHLTQCALSWCKTARTIHKSILDRTTAWSNADRTYTVVCVCVFFTMAASTANRLAVHAIYLVRTSSSHQLKKETERSWNKQHQKFLCAKAEFSFLLG